MTTFYECINIQNSKFKTQGRRGLYFILSSVFCLEEIARRVTIALNAVDMATHSVVLVPLFLDRLFILSKGRIVRSGPPAEVFTAPEEMAQVKLRLPLIAELIYQLRNEDGMHFDKLPLMVGEARRELIKTMKDYHA